MSKEQAIESTFRGGVRKIVLNRPYKKNALNKYMYETLTQILEEDSQNKNVVVTIITGAGDFYSSGNDFVSNLEENTPSLNCVKKFIEALIEYPKLIIAVLNGPAIGIAAATTTLCDVVYASDRAYLHTPFLLGLCAEGTSSYMFPRILGRSKASEAILLAQKITSQDAYRLGLISAVIPHEQVPGFIESLYQYGSLPVNGIKINKKLMMKHMKNQLFKVSDIEFKTLEECVQSDEFAQFLLNFMKKKSKL